MDLGTVTKSYKAGEVLPARITDVSGTVHSPASACAARIGLLGPVAVRLAKHVAVFTKHHLEKGAVERETSSGPQGIAALLTAASKHAECRHAAWYPAKVYTGGG